MKSIKELYRIGTGPSSSHTMAPRRAAEMFQHRNPECKRFRVTLYGSLAATGKGHLTDHFNPVTMTVNLSDSVYSSRSIAAAAVACHECGHAIQHAQGYAPLVMRSALVPVVNFASKAATWVIIAVIAIMASTNSTTLCWIGIGMIAMNTDQHGWHRVQISGIIHSTRYAQ